MIKNAIYFCLVIVLLTVSGCTNQSTSETEKLQDQLKEHEQEMISIKEEYELHVNNIEEEKDAYKAFIAKSTDYLEENELLELAKSEWHYNIEINDDLVPANGKVEINKNDFKIIYSEKQASHQILPSEIYMQGAINGDYFEHLVIKGVEPEHIRRTDGTIVTAFIYEFKNVPSDTTIELEVSDELKDRLRLATNLINIKVN
ncbi:hypothetical protein [Paraliobacillus salinarum]|uniref:hypothetical protein n=1 Tax=Paraliobacillus salinarum TaxID=1158996 RepID=UPI0015F6E07F|nr:hypothetical protein [Paraliobacillus salinarum]